MNAIAKNWNKNIFDQITSLTAMETLSQSNPYFGV